MQILHESSGSTSRREKRLKKMIQGLNGRTIELIFTELVKEFEPKQKGIKEGSFQKTTGSV